MDQPTRGQIVRHRNRDLFGQIVFIVATGEGDTETIVLYVKTMDVFTGDFTGPQRAWFADLCDLIDDEPADVPNIHIPGEGWTIL